MVVRYNTDELHYAQAMKKGHLATVSGRPTDRAQAIGDTPLFEVHFGCYVELSGTNPHGFGRIGKIANNGWDDDEGDDDN